MLLIFLLITLAIFFLVYYYQYVHKTTTNTFHPNNEVPLKNNQSNVAELLFFYTDWCPHCKVSKPEWNAVKQEYNNQEINGYHIVFTDINCEDQQNTKLMDQYDVKGFPTIKMIKDGQVIEFDAKPTKENLTQFINTML